MYTKTFLFALYAAITALAIAQSCKDSNTFTWTNPNGTTRNCLYAAQVRSSFRKELCTRTFNGNKVENECRKTCGNCNLSESLSCTNSDFVWTNPHGTERDCSYVANVNASFRKELCARTIDGKKVQNECRMACDDNCKSTDTNSEPLVDAVGVEL